MKVFVNLKDYTGDHVQTLESMWHHWAVGNEAEYNGTTFTVKRVKIDLDDNCIRVFAYCGKFK
jgi:hypothetical protein